MRRRIASALLFCVLLPSLAVAAPKPSRKERILLAVSRAKPWFPRIDWTTWERADIDPDNAEAVLRQLSVHAQRYPEPARDLWRLECINSGFVGDQVAVTWHSGTFQMIGLRFKDIWLRSDRGTAARKASHEWAHVLDFWVSYKDGASIDAFKREELGVRGDPRGHAANELVAECFEEFYWVKPKKQRPGAAKVDAYLNRTFPL